MHRLLLIGAGGHARVVIDVVRTRNEYEIVGLVQRDRAGEPVDGVPIVGSDDDLPALRSAGATHGVVAVAGLRPDTRRAALFDLIRASGLIGAVIVHRDATVSPRATVGEGSMVFARAVLNPGAQIGKNVIVNTASVIEHDCTIGDHAHVLPGAVVGGAVRVGAHAHIGIGATVVRGITIGARALVDAGAVVVEDVADDAHVAGVPARPVR